MGANRVRRLMEGGHECVVYNIHLQSVYELVAHGAIGADSLGNFVSRPTQPRAVWLRVPATVVDQELAALIPLLEAGDIVIDGGWHNPLPEWTRK